MKGKNLRKHPKFPGDLSGRQKLLGFMYWNILRFFGSTAHHYGNGSGKKTSDILEYFLF